MHTKLQDAYSEFLSHKCSEKGHGKADCGIVVPHSFMSVCAKHVRDMLGGIYKEMEICDCIIFDPSEAQISLVELKSGTPKKRKIRVLNKARRQLVGGLKILFKILYDMGVSDVMLQLVIANNLPFRSMSTQKNFQKRIDCPVSIRVVLADCNSLLPNEYISVDIPKSGRRSDKCCGTNSSH